MDAPTEPTRTPVDPASPPVGASGYPNPGYSMPIMPVVAAPTVSPLLATQPRRMSAVSLLLGVAVLVAIGGVAFAAGRMTAPPATSAAATTRGGNGAFGNGGFGSVAPGASGAAGAPGASGRGGLGALGGGEVTISGTVSKISSDSITLTLPTGTTIEIPINNSTTYHRQAAAASGDIATGSTVQVAVTGALGGGGFRGANGGNANGGGAGQASPPPPVGGSAPAASPGAAAGAPGQAGAGGFQLSPARDITLVTP